MSAGAALAEPVTAPGLPEQPGPVSPVERPAQPQARAPQPAVEQSIDTCVSSAMRAALTSGASVAVALDGVTLLEKGYGVKHEVQGGAVGPRTVFRVGSVTKMLTTAAVLQQAEAGRLSLDDRLARWVEGPIATTLQGGNVTVRQLLNHTSGIPDLPFDLQGPAEDEALASWVGKTLPLWFWSASGAFWNYSNPNYVLAGMVAERASGTPFRTLVQTQVLDVAGMTDTTFDPHRVVAAGDFAWGHWRDPLTGRRVIYHPTDYSNAAIAPAGYLFSSAPDLLRWAQLLMDGGGTVLTEGSVAQLLGSRVGMGYRHDQQYGLGVFREEYGGLEVFQHSGFIPGWGAMLLWVPERRFAVAVLGNGPAPLTQAATCVATEVLDLSSGAPPDVTTDPSWWDGFEGTYRGRDVLGRPFEAVVSRSGTRLTATITGLGVTAPFVATLAQQNPDVFLADADGDGIADFDLTFVRFGGSGTPARWLRNRQLVGERVGRARRRIPAA